MNDSNYKSYDEFLLRNGGKSNSYTSLNTTNFHFEIFNQGFDEGLHRFAEFFSKPKFKNTKEQIKLLKESFNDKAHGDD